VTTASLPLLDPIKAPNRIRKPNMKLPKDKTIALVINVDKMAEEISVGL
jgi:hypothetical protein